MPLRSRPVATPTCTSVTGTSLGDLEQPERGLAGARGVVLVRDRRAEDGVQVGALVADRQLQHRAALLVERPLRAGHEVVEHLRRLAGRPRSRGRRTARRSAPPGGGRRGTRRDRPPSAPTPAAAATGGRSPRAAAGQSGGGVERSAGAVDQRRDDADRTVLALPDLAQGRPGRPATPGRPRRGRRRRHRPAPRRRPGSPSAGRPARRSSCTRGSPTTKRCTSPTATATLTPSVTALPAGHGDGADPVHHLLHGQAAGRRPAAVVAVDPRRDRVAAEVDDAAAPRVQRLHQRREDPVERGAQLLGTASFAELARQGLGERA